MSQPFVVAPGRTLSLSLVGTDTAQTPPECFAFVTNVSKIVGAEELTLFQGYKLRRATSREVQKIKELLSCSTEGLFGLRDFPWEYNRDADGNAIPLPESEWRYFVIAFQEFGMTDLYLQYTFPLVRLELEVAFLAGPAPTVPGRAYPVAIHHSGRLFQLLDQFKLGTANLFDATATDAEEVSRICSLLQSHDKEVVNIQQIAAQLLEFEALPRGRPALFLAYFGILESLLTHRPQPTDPYDSITRQVKRKVALLNNRWSPQIDYSLFGDAKPDAVWGKMYAYRSSLAHGDVPDFKNGELRALGGPDNAMALLKSTVKAVSRLALSEPQLIADLKDC